MSELQDKADQARARAINLVKQFNVDSIVRAVAKSDTSPDRINKKIEWDGLIIKATFGAGTNSASVKTDNGLVLYEAMEYGKYIQAFRFGPWVDRLTKRAEELKATQEPDDSRRLIDTIEKFSDVDI